MVIMTSLMFLKSRCSFHQTTVNIVMRSSLKLYLIPTEQSMIKAS